MFGELIDLDFMGTPMPTNSGGSSFLPEGFNLSGAFRDEAPRMSLGVGTGSGAEGLRLSSEAATPLTPERGGENFWTKLSTAIKGAGNIASGVLPIASVGAGILGAINSRQLMNQIAEQAPLTRRAIDTQITSAEQGQQLAPKAAAVAPEIQALAPRFDELSRLVQERSAAFNDLAGQIKTAGADTFGSLSNDVRTRVANPVIDYGNKLLAMADAGTLLEPDLASLDDWERRAIADAEGFLARAGQGDSTARNTILSDIRAKRATAESQMLSGYRNQALQYLQTGGGQLTSGAGALTAQQIQALVQSGSLTQAEIQALLDAGRLTQAQAATLGASVVPLTAAGSILSGSAGAAGAAGALSRQEEQSLEQLIANLQAQLGLGNARS